MKNLSLTLLLSLALLLNSSAHADDSWSGNLNLFLGSKVLDDSDWLADAHGEVGLLFDFGRRDWPVNIVVDILRSRGDFTGFAYNPGIGILYVEEEVTTRELNLGVRHYFDLGSNMTPYIGGGLALISLKADTRIDGGPWWHDEGKGSGIWLNGGIKWDFDAFNIGFDIRSSVADVSMDAGNFSGGGGHAGLVLGTHW